MQQQSSRNIQRTLNASLSAQSQIQNQITQQIQQQQQSQIQQQKQSQILALITVQQPVTSYSPIGRTPIRPPTKLPTKPVIPFLPMFGGAGKPRGKKPIPASGQGFQVYIKSRQYYQGKLRGKEKYRLLSSTVYSYNDAKSMMGYIVDNSVAQRGRIKPVNKPISKSRRRSPVGWSSIGFKFTRDNSGNYLEGRAHAIDSRGEKMQLNAFKLHRSLPIIKGMGGSDFNVNMYGLDALQTKLNKRLRRMRIK